MAYDFSLIHSFSIKDTHILLDIHSGIVHSLSKEASDFLQVWQAAAGDPEFAAAKLSAKYEKRELEQIIGEFTDLIQGGLLFSKDKDLDNYQMPQDAVVKALCLHVAHDCNLRCRYCFAGTGDFGGERGVMNLETGKRAFDFLFAAAGPRKHLEVDYFGGEPLLNYHVVKELIQYGKKKAVALGKELKQTLTTNAVLLDQEKIDFFNREEIHLILSIDGRPAVHDQMRPFPGQKGSYAQVAQAIKKYIENQTIDTYYVRGTYTHFNPDFCEDICHLVKEGFTRLSLEPVVAAPVNDYALKEEDLPLLFEQYERLAEISLDYYRTAKPFEFFHFNLALDKGPCLPKRLSGCGAGHEYLAVSPEGELYPCHQFMGQEEFLIGSVWDGISNQELGKQFRSAHVLNKSECQSCWARFLCSGGCHANAYNFNKDIYKPYRLGCEIQKKRLECAIYLQVKKHEWDEGKNTNE